MIRWLLPSINHARVVITPSTKSVWYKGRPITVVTAQAPAASSNVVAADD
ncbi:MAG: hypothetical protein M3507_03700 [Actinomycetota bacterium]|nr:hypothetical protein [Actinomycetota bacterium]